MKERTVKKRDNERKKLGLVGGMGPESTMLYYRDIVYGVQKRVGQGYFPGLTVESVNAYKVLELCKKQDYETLTEYLLDAVQDLGAAGADFAALSANTPHIVFDRLEKLAPIPLVSIIETTCQEVQRREMKRVGLLGTIFTMNGAFYRQPFEAHGITVITPTEPEKAIVNEKIVDELEQGIVKPETLAAFLTIVNRMVEKEHIEGLILGCTELPLLFHGLKTPVPVLDTVEIHVEALIDRIIGES